MSATTALRHELASIAARKAQRADRLMLAMGACDATRDAYMAAADGLAMVGEHTASVVYRVRAARVALLLEAEAGAATPTLNAPRTRFDKPTVRIEASGRLPDGIDRDVASRPGFVPRIVRS